MEKIFPVALMLGGATGTVLGYALFQPPVLASMLTVIFWLGITLVVSAYKYE